MSRTQSVTPYVQSTLRIIVAFLFIQAGTVKLFAFPAALMPGGIAMPSGTMIISDFFG